MAGVDADPERHDTAVLGEVHPIDHERDHIKLGQAGAEQVGQGGLGHRHQPAQYRRLAGRGG